MNFVHVIERDNFTDMYKRLQFDLKNEGILTYPRDMPSREIANVNLILTNPRERLLYSRVRKHNYTYGAAEFMWYLAGSNKLDFIGFYLPRMKDYSDDGVTLNSGYGYRIFGQHEDFPDQWLNVVSKFQEDTNSRQGVITIHYQNDLINPSKDVPCTMNLHFMIRNNRLNLFVQMRSNDAYMGLIYDVFSFTLLQEHMMNQLRGICPDRFGNLELGTYVHRSDSMHLYDRDLEGVSRLMVESKMEVPNLSALDLILNTTELFKLRLDEVDLRMGNEPIIVNQYTGMCKFMAEKLNKILDK